MIRFNCDYSEGAHPNILERLTQTNFEQHAGYGHDIYCKQAEDLIKQLCHAPHAQVHFLSGGTQTNLTVIASLLQSYECVISADSGHINVFETRAIEATGHHVYTVPNHNGKITAAQVSAICTEHISSESPEFTPMPRAVYISFPTETGTLYSKEELYALHKVCQENGLFLFMDGARLGYGLTAKTNDVTLADIAACCDVFYIGGTKLGALFGEAVVLVNPKLQKNFRYFMKQRGAMLAKGRLLGIQFIELLKNNLYFDLAKSANRYAMQIREVCEQVGWKLLHTSFTNQQFPIIPNSCLKKLEEKYSFSHIKAIDTTHTAVRICTSWATNGNDVSSLIADIQRIAKI